MEYMKGYMNKNSEFLSIFIYNLDVATWESRT